MVYFQILSHNPKASSMDESRRMTFAPFISSTPRSSIGTEESDTCDLGKTFNALMISEKEVLPALPQKESSSRNHENKISSTDSSDSTNRIIMKKRMQSEISLLSSEIDKLKVY